MGLIEDARAALEEDREALLLEAALSLKDLKAAFKDVTYSTEENQEFVDRSNVVIVALMLMAEDAP